MNRTPLKRKTPLKAKARLNTMSAKKIAELWAEQPERQALADRCGGELFIEVKTHRHNGKVSHYPRYWCLNGTCEICHTWQAVLEPHEDKVLRSHGGRVSLDNSKMVCRDCHIKEQPQVGRLNHE